MNYQILTDLIYKCANNCKLAMVKILNGKTHFGPAWFGVGCKEAKKRVNATLKRLRKNKSVLLKFQST